MYLPSLLFGGSSILHLLAGYPRVVAAFGLSALMATLLQTPFGTRDVPGTAGLFKRLDAMPFVQQTVDSATIDHAHASARRVRDASQQRLAEVVEHTLRECGQGCIGLSTEAVLRNQALLDDVLIVHASDGANVRARATRDDVPVGGTSPRH